MGAVSSARSTPLRIKIYWLYFSRWILPDQRDIWRFMKAAFLVAPLSRHIKQGCCRKAVSKKPRNRKERLENRQISERGVPTILTTTQDNIFVVSVASSSTFLAVLSKTFLWLWLITSVSEIHISEPTFYWCYSEADIQRLANWRKVIVPLSRSI